MADREDTLMARKPAYEELEQRVRNLEKESIERKKKQEMFRESEEKYRHLTESLLDVVYEFDREGKFTYVNETATHMFGYSKKEILGGLRVEDIIVEEDKVVLSKAIEIKDWSSGSGFFT
jgi:PAS domain-containing protein